MIPKICCGLLPRIISPSIYHLCPSLVFCAFCFLTPIHPIQSPEIWPIGLGPNAAPRSFRTWAPSVASISGKPLFPMRNRGIDVALIPSECTCLKLITVAMATSCETERGLNYKESLDLLPPKKNGVSKLRRYISHHSAQILQSALKVR